MDAREKILKAKYIGPCLTKKMSGQVCGRPCIGEICHKCLFNVGSQGTNAKAKTKAKEKPLEPPLDGKQIMKLLDKMSK